MSTIDPTSVKAIALDFNGVVVDDEQLHLDAFREAFKPHGFEITDTMYWNRYCAYDDEGALKMMAQDCSEIGIELTPDELNQTLEKKIQIYMNMIGDHPPFFDGAIEMIKNIASQIPIGIVSGARREEIEMTLKAGDIERYIQFIVAAEDTPQSKPDPAPYIKSCELHKLSPESIVAIEDSVGGIQSAKAANLRVIAVTHTYDESKLSDADLICTNLAEITTSLSCGS